MSLPFNESSVLQRSKSGQQNDVQFLPEAAIYVYINCLYIGHDYHFAVLINKVQHIVVSYLLSFRYVPQWPACCQQQHCGPAEYW